MSEDVRRVPLPEVSDLLAIGEPLPFKVLDAQGRLLLAAGQVIASARQLEALIERGACVEYPEAEAVRRARAGDPAVAGVEANRRTRNLFDRWEERLWALDTLLRSLGRHAGQGAEIEAFADDFIGLVDREPDVALFLCVRQDDRRFALYGLAHALHTAVVVLLSARQLGWPAAQVQRTVRTALTMNAAIVELQARMAEQRDPPSRKQLDEIRAHPQGSAQRLRDSGVVDAEWLAAVEQHHEQASGAGYPLGSKTPGDIARLVRAADVFMAKISPRALRAPLLPQVAARQLFQEDAGGPIAAALIKAVGVYPPGDFVRLRNGDVAIVIRRAAGGAAGPGVLAVSLIDAKGRPLPNAPKRDTAQPEFAIAGLLTERAGLRRVLPEQVYGVLEAGDAGPG
jgi:hypothetical protein